MKITFATTGLLLAFFITALSSSATAQATLLDEERGFEAFTLNDPISKWESQLTYLHSGVLGGKTYLYKGDCCQEIFDRPTRQIRLKFKDDKISQILIYLEYWDKEEAGNCYAELQQLEKEITARFNQEREHVANQSGAFITHLWRGENSQLSVHVMDEGEAGCVPYIIWTDKTEMPAE